MERRWRGLSPPRTKGKLCLRWAKPTLQLAREYELAMATYIDKVLGISADELTTGRARKTITADGWRSVARPTARGRREIRYVESVCCGYCRGSGKDASGNSCGVCKGESSIRVDPPVVQCLECRGTGHGKGHLTCLACRGVGVVSVRQGATTCPRCDGTGRSGAFYCTHCRGQGIA